MTPVKTLKELEGSVIAAIVPLFHPTQLQELLLHKVEDAGIWVESQAAMEMAFKQFGATHSARTLVFFLPWQQITFVMGKLDVPALSEKALGL